MFQSLIYSLAIIIFDLTPVAFDPCDCWSLPLIACDKWVILHDLFFS